MKKDKMIYWITTSIIFLFDSVLPAFTSHTEMAREGISHLGYPDYFRVQLTVFKILGGLILILPQIPPRLKEWAYAGFAINFISAFIAYWVVDGLSSEAFFPLFILLILITSYHYFHKLQKAPFTGFNYLSRAEHV